MKSKKIKLLIMIIFITAAVALGVIGYLVLPETLVMQLTFSGQGGTTMPKLLGLLIPLAICVIFPVMYYKKDNEGKNLMISFIGIVFYALIFIFNL